MQNNCVDFKKLYEIRTQSEANSNFVLMILILRSYIQLKEVHILSYKITYA